MTGASYSKTLRDQARLKRRKARADRRERQANNEDQVGYLLSKISSGKGGVFVMNHVHDVGCKRPSGGPCACADEPALQVLDGDAFIKTRSKP